MTNDLKSTLKEGIYKMISVLSVPKVLFIKSVFKRDCYSDDIFEQKIIENLDSSQKQEIENSVEPVFITLSANLEQESLKKLIKKSIGIELW